MEAAPEVIKTLAETPATILALIAVLAAFALAGFAIYVVHEHTKQKPRR